MEKLKAFISKRVYGVPMSVILLVAAVLLGGLAYAINGRTPDAATDDTDDGSSEGEGDITGTEQPVFRALPSVPPSAPDIAPVESILPGEPAELSNDAWRTKAIEILVAGGMNATDASRAVHNFLNGENLSYQDGVGRDAAVGQIGLPPIPPGPATTDVYRGPASRQGTPPLTHVVKGTSDNQPGELAMLYYGHATAADIALIKGAGNTNSVYSPGDKVFVPGFATSATPLAIHAVPTAGNSSVTSIPTALVNTGPIMYTIKANETMPAYQGRVHAAYGFMPSLSTLKKLNPSQSKLLDNAAGQGDTTKHAAVSLRVK